MLSLPVLLTASVALALLGAPGQTSAQLLPSYKCPSGQQRVLTDYGGYTFQLDVSPASSPYLQPNMNCGIYIVGYSYVRWMITLDNVSLNAYQAELNIQDASIGGKQLITVKSTGTVYRQIVTNSGSFNVRLVTKSSPGALVTGVKMTIEQIDRASCPSSWYTLPGSSGYCYGVPRLVGNLTYDDATTGCKMAAANLVMGNYDYDSISSELMAAPMSMLNPKVAYWVGLYSSDGDVKFLNKYKSLDGISGKLCSSSSGSCNCVAYQNSKFYLDDCKSRRPYICYMPKGGADTYYDVTSLMSTASTVITLVAIVLTVCFILAVIISLIVVLVCCIRRKSALHRDRLQQQQGSATAGAGVVLGYPHQAPPPYPVGAPGQAPPYIIDVPAPPYAVYQNTAYDEAANNAAEKPPAYNPDWSGQQVPA